MGCFFVKNIRDVSLWARPFLLRFGYLCKQRFAKTPFLHVFLLQVKLIDMDFNPLRS